MLDLAKHADIAVELLRRMKLIRCVEERIAAHYPQGRMRCPTHLSTGQEAVPAAMGMALSPQDRAVSTHRGHAHYLGKGGDMRALLAELYGKAAGCSGGRGGSMHLTDPEAGFIASTAIVGNSVPLGVGLAFAAQYLSVDRVSVVFMGDAVVEQGVFHESANFAVLYRLPVLFVCENNLYSVYSPISVRQPAARRIFQMAAAHGMNAFVDDGNNVWSVYERMQSVLPNVRAGKGPVFLEFETYRWREHCGPFIDDQLDYRPLAEREAWLQRDPIASFQERLKLAGLLTSQQIDEMNGVIEQEVHAAIAYAEAAPFPDPNSARTGLFAGGGA